MSINYRDSKFGRLYANDQALAELDGLLGTYAEKGAVVFFLVDENTHEMCLSRLVPELPSLGECEILEVPPGEDSKSIEIAAHLWSSLSELGADRHSLMVNVGGGMVTDLGGFVASTYKRGIDFAHVPTSLLGMVDASIGGKTGIDLAGVKNLVGTFAESKGVFLIPDFLETLPVRETKAGFAEMIKHALITSEAHWNEIVSTPIDALWENPDVIRASMAIKLNVVDGDPKEGGDRQFLNFGHTIGHAVESYFLSSETQESLLHGEAVALGMWLAVELSIKQVGLDAEIGKSIQTFIEGMYDLPLLPPSDFDGIMEWLNHDKKNEGGVPQFVLLEGVGQPIRGCKVDVEDIQSAIETWNTK